MGEHWKDWTDEQWRNAIFCEECGLPMLEVEDAPNHGHYECVFCTWQEDENIIENGLRAQIRKLEKEKSQLIKSIVDLTTIIQLLKDKYSTNQNPKD
jgi:hypothetical protein